MHDAIKKMLKISCHSEMTYQCSLKEIFQEIAFRS